MRIALLFGSSGLVGGHLLRLLLNDNSFSKIKLFVRKVPKINDPRVEIIKTNFKNLLNHKEDIIGSDCFFCIGTTKQKTPNKEEYRRVELGIPKDIAKIAKSNLLNSFIFISALYANPRGWGDYVRYKGLVEEELKKLEFPKLAIMRPSFLLGERKEKRTGEKIGIYIFNFLSPILSGPLEKLKPIHSETVARAMLAVANREIHQITFESNEIHEIIKK